MKKSPLSTVFPDVPNVKGIEFAVGNGGFKYKNRNDFLLVKLAPDTKVSGVFTSSSTRSAAIDYCRNALDNKNAIGGLVINSGNSNAFTGRLGVQANQNLVDIAQRLLDTADSVLPCSTGVIGEVLNTETFNALQSVDFSANWLQAAGAIMTTDTFEKASYRQVEIAGQVVTVAGIAKGSGMIAPDMATMLGYVFTDMNISQDMLDKILKESTGKSFNSITVDGDTSTSDSVIACATAKADVPINADIEKFEEVFTDVCKELAHMIVKDGEGASKFIQVQVTDAVTDESAKIIALSIANSPLVKTAIAGEDANWGRIVMAVGKSGQPADRDSLSVSVGGIVIAENGQGAKGYDENPVATHLKGQNIDICVSLGLGNGNATVWTCDLTHGYITINADYRS